MKKPRSKEIQGKDGAQAYIENGPGKGENNLLNHRMANSKYFSEHTQALLWPLLLISLSVLGLIVIAVLLYKISRYHRKFYHQRLDRSPEISTQYSRISQVESKTTTFGDFEISSRDQFATLEFHSKPIFIENIPSRVLKLLQNEDQEDILLKEFESVPKIMSKVGFC